MQVAILLPCLLVLTACLGWQVKYTGNSSEISYQSISCPSATLCVAVGADTTGRPLIIRTSDGGSSWSHAGGAALSGVNALDAVSCPDTGHCFAGGTGSGAVLKSSDGGASWTSAPTIVGASAVRALSCIDLSNCYATVTGAAGIDQVAKTTNAGTAWLPRYAAASNSALKAISCPSTSVCYAAGATNPGTGLGPSFVITTKNGGLTWTSSNTSVEDGSALGISCPTTTACMATVAASAGAQTIFTTSDGGATWVDRSDAADNQLGGRNQTMTSQRAVSCTSPQHCTVVGKPATGSYGAPVIVTSDGGATWLPQPAPAPTPQGSGASAYTAVSCPTGSVCFATGNPEVQPVLGGTGPGFVTGTTNGGQASPQIYSLSVHQGDGVTVTIRGNRLSSGTPTVYFGKRPAVSVTVVSDSQLSVVSPTFPAGERGDLVDLTVNTSEGTSPLVFNDQWSTGPVA